MRLLMVLLLVVVFLAGCSNSSSGKDADGSSTTGTGAGTPFGNATKPPPALPSIEVYNDTIAFPSKDGGSAGSASFEVPKGYGNVTVKVTTFGDCPGGYVLEAAIAVTAPTVDASVPLEFDEFATGVSADGHTPYSCAIADGVDHRELGNATMTWPTQQGSGTLAAEGEFTGNALVVVVAGP